MRLFSLLTLCSAAVVLSGCAEEQPHVEVAGDNTPAAAYAESAATSKAATSAHTAQHKYCGGAQGQAPSGTLTPTRIEAANNDAPGLYEGPVWIDDALYFSSFTFTEGFPSQVMKLKDGELSVAIDDSGSNGLAVDSEGHLIAGTHKYKSVSRYNLADGSRENVIGEFEGNVFNSPNDLTLTTDGVLYFTDPDFQTSAAPGGQEATRVYRVEGEQITVVDDTISNPNGVSLSPDESVLYVAGGGENGVLRAYSIVDGVPGEGRDLAPIAVPDGMAIDCLGNIYTTEHSLQRLRVFNPEGEQIAEIPVDANVTNAAFGGPERKTLYITGAGSLWSLELDVAGLPY
ncbi:MAG TPA: SMP-30/gluconolactonase/LRE family protein [Cellvibrionaceae bacterium]